MLHCRMPCRNAECYIVECRNAECYRSALQSSILQVIAFRHSAFYSVVERYPCRALYECIRSVPSSEFGVPSSEFRVRSSEFGVPSSEFGVPSSEFGVPECSFFYFPEFPEFRSSGSKFGEVKSEKIKNWGVNKEVLPEKTTQTLPEGTWNLLTYLPLRLKV